MGPQLDRVAREYSVPVFSNGGNNSISAQRQVTDHALSRSVPTVLLHVGDFDPSGEDIFTAFVENAQAFLDKDRIVGTQRIEPVRVALTDAQVQRGLPTQPTTPKKNSKPPSSRPPVGLSRGSEGSPTTREWRSSVRRWRSHNRSRSRPFRQLSGHDCKAPAWDEVRDRDLTG